MEVEGESGCSDKLKVDALMSCLSGRVVLGVAGVGQWADLHKTKYGCAVDH